MAPTSLWIYINIDSCVQIQGLHTSEAAFEGQLRHNAARRLL